MSFSSLELQIVQILNSFPALDPLMVFLSVIGEGPLWILIGAYLFLSGSRRTAIYFGMMGISVWLTSTFLKSVLMVPRPGGFRFVLEATGYSFPSTHSALAFATAMFLNSKAGKYSPLLWAGALLMAVSRVFAGVHYPSDVMAGAVLGIVMGYMWIRIGSAVNMYMEKRADQD
ncbi:phosphatase PAP2 family protein [Methanococcoides cohabitans]|uniref:Phosphatase PAP2 family protein n=1 Tax=Methanococcoides cohabitans TaxID=3136559 RepID=A0ABU9KUW3_9EURY